MRATKSRRSPRSSSVSEAWAAIFASAERSRASASSRSGALVVLRRDQQQAFGFGPGAKGLAGGVGFFQRQGAFDPTQQLLGLATGTIAGMAANDLRRRLERTNRLVGMNDEVDGGMDSVLRHARPTAPARTSSISPSGWNLGRNSRLFSEHPAVSCYRSPWNSQRLLKIAAFAHSDSGVEHGRRRCRA